MFSFLKKQSFLRRQAFPIGVDMGTDVLKAAQLGCDDNGVFIMAGACEKMPEHLEVGSSQWQRWAVGTLKQLTSNGSFCGRDVVAAMSADEVFIEQIKVSRQPSQKLDDTILTNIQAKLSFDARDALVKYVVTGESSGGESREVDVLVMATERVKVDRHLAIYENANLEVKRIVVWPLALAKTYVTFFGRRQSDKDKTVMLVQIGANFTNVDICRGSALLFARLIPMGFKKLDSAEMAKRLVLELSACENYFESVSGMNRIERLIYLSGQNSDKNICDNLAQLAQRRHIPAQLADVLGAVNVRPDMTNGFDRRNCRVNWATAFGLSLS